MKHSVNLYRFFGPRVALQTLETGMMKVGLPHEFNDPFDCVFGVEDAFSGYPESLMIARAQFAEMLLKNVGMFCFSEISDNTLMWSHYAEKHQGIALEFSLSPNNSLFPVKYSEIRPQITHEMTQAEPELSQQQDIVREILETKSLDWRYEKEWRLLVSLEDPHLKVKDGNYLAPLLPLVRIILGAKSQIRSDYIRRSIRGKDYEDVPIMRASMSHSRFCVEIGPA